jgi:hypothetical protein
MGNIPLFEKPNLSTRAPHRYLLCGWHTHSEIPLTGVPTSKNDRGNLDVKIELATGDSPMTKSTGQSFFRHTMECSLIRIEDVADFEITGGQQIRVWPVAGAKQKDIEIFLFGPAWATLCHQRGILPLHASAIVTEMGGVMAFAGPSGVGKSTTAALLNSLGYQLVTDDILPVRFDQNAIPGAWPYLRRLKLHREPIAELAFTSRETVSEALDKEKYFVYPKHAADDQWSRLERVYLLEIDPTCPRVSIDRIIGAEAVGALIDQTYHFKFILGSGRVRDHLSLCAYLVSKIAIYRMRRSPSVRAGIELGSMICAHLKETQSHNPIEPKAMLDVIGIK